MGGVSLFNQELFQIFAIFDKTIEEKSQAFLTVTLFFLFCIDFLTVTLNCMLIWKLDVL
jgi:hypothetical protein